MNAFFYHSKRGINFAKIRGFKVTDYTNGRSGERHLSELAQLRFVAAEGLLFRLRCRLLRRDKDVSKYILGTCLRYDLLFIAVFPMSRSTDSSSGIAPRILVTLLKSLLEPFYPVVYHETSMVKPMRELGELGRQQDWSDKIVWRFRNLG